MTTLKLPPDLWFNSLDVEPGVKPSPPLGYVSKPIMPLIESLTTFSSGWYIFTCL